MPTMSSFCKNFFLIIAPGYPAYDTHAATSLKETFEKGLRALNGRVQSIGDGVQPIEVNSLKESFQTFSEDLEEPFGIVVRAHGNVENLEFFLKLGDKWIANSLLLNILRTTSSSHHPISIIYTSCYSHAAVRDATDLPTGSVVVGLSDTGAIDTDIQRWIDALCIKWPTKPSVLSLLEAYLLHGIRNRYSPKIAIVSVFSTREYVLHDLFLRILGTRIPQAAVVRVREGDTGGGDTIGRVAAKISNARHEYSIYAAEYGAALALALECEFSTNPSS